MNVEKKICEKKMAIFRCGLVIYIPLILERLQTKNGITVQYNWLCSFQEVKRCRIVKGIYVVFNAVFWYVVNPTQDYYVICNDKNFVEGNLFSVLLCCVSCVSLFAKHKRKKR